MTYADEWEMEYKYYHIVILFSLFQLGVNT